MVYLDYRQCSEEFGIDGSLVSSAENRSSFKEDFLFNRIQVHFELIQEVSPKQDIKLEVGRQVVTNGLGRCSESVYVDISKG